MGNEKKIFISYSHEDEKWKNLLVGHLKVLQLEGFYDVWDDRRIQLGDDRKTEIEGAVFHREEARKLIEETGYKRREKEIGELGC